MSELANGVVSQMLKDHPELTKAQTDAIRQWTATALGAAIGGQAGAAAALDNIKHNYLKHEEQLQLEAAEAACKAGDQAACEEQQRLEEKDAVQQQQLLACYQSGYQGDGCAAVFADMVAALSSYSGIATFLLPEEYRAKLLTDNRGSVEQIFNIMAPEGVDKLSDEKLKELNNLVNLLVGDPTGVTAAPVLLDDILNGNFSDAGARLVSIFSRKVIGNGAIGVGKGGGAPNRTGVVDDAVDASTPVGRRTGFDETGPDGIQPDGSGRQTPQTKNGGTQPVINQPATIGGRDYSGHALDQMRNRGVTPSVVENTISSGTRVPGNTPGTFEYVDNINGVNVVVNSSGRVITVK